jgi:Uncharacterized protein involved in purine metabolism
MNKTAKQTLALASIFQSTALVHQLASTGQCDSHTNRASLNSIVNESDSVDEIFTSPEDLKIGFRFFKVFIRGKVNRYA